MAINDILSTYASSQFHNVQSDLGNLKAMWDNMVGGATATFQSLWDGGFVGIDANNYEVIKTAITQMIEKIENTLSQFNANAEMESGLKGEASEAAAYYVQCVNRLLSDYATTYRNLVILADNAVEQMKQGDTENAAAIRTDAENLVREGSQIRVEL